MALIRTSDKTGYYVDIYRSDNTVSNDYVYHNIGDQLSFFNSKREPQNAVATEYPLTGKDYPGFRFFTDVRKLTNWSENLIALFSVKDPQSKEIFMQLLVPGKNGRDYYQAKSLKTKTSGRVYAGKPLPVFTMRDKGESKNVPFISVFEPYRDKNGYSVDRISLDQRSDGAEFTALTVYNRDLSKQYILQALDLNKAFTSDKITFCGHFGVVGMKGENISSIYLGEGKEISCNGFVIRIMIAYGSANLAITDGRFYISCNQETDIEIPVSNVQKLTIVLGSRETEIKFTEKAKGINFKLPAVKNGEIRINKLK
jgi:hypothetical protein